MSTIHAYDGYDDQTNASTPADAAGKPHGLATSEQRFKAALACLGAAYALSWVEFALTLAIGLPGDASSHPMAASIVSRVLIGVLYLCVASRFQWARWVTVALGLASVALVAPTLALQWHILPTAAVLSGATIVFKLAASLFLISPMPRRAHR